MNALEISVLKLSCVEVLVMKKIIGIGLCLSCLLTGCSASVSSNVNDSTSVTTSKTPEEKAEELVSAMDLQTKIEQMIMPSIRNWNGEGFTELNDEVQSMLEKYHFGGIILFAENFSDNASVVNLTQGLQMANASGGGIPYMLSIDQEGGYITRLQYGTSTVGNMALAASGKTKNAKKSAKIISSELKALGLNLDFAPTVDVNANPANPIIGVRAFSDDPEIVTEFSEAYLSGLASNNVIGTIKHFPGHGDTDTDSHTGLPRIDRTKEEVENTDLIPYKELIEDGKVDMIMSAHIQFPQIETETYTSIKDGSTINLPATLSKTWLTDILRNELGFEGVIVTDSLQMDAIAENFSTRDSAKLAINAGVNILLMPVELENVDSMNAMDAYIQDIVDMVNNGEIDESLIDESCKKIIALKYQRGIMDETFSDEKTQEMLTNVDALVGSEESHKIERNIGDDCITVLKNENDTLPYTVRENENIVMISTTEVQKNILDHGFLTLKEEGVIDSSATIQIMNENNGENHEACLNAIDQANILIVTSTLDSSTQIDTTQSDRIRNVQEYISKAKSLGIPVIAISAKIPYDTALLQDADAIVCAYNSKGAINVDDLYNPLSTYSVNLMCAEDIIFGSSKPKGKLPVNVPNVENGQFTSDILYERGTGLTW